MSELLDEEEKLAEILRTADDEKNVYFKMGEYTIPKDWVIPDNYKFNFDNEAKVTSEKLFIMDRELKFTNMHFDGYIKIMNSKVTFENCTFTSEKTKTDYIIDVDYTSNIVITHCTFINAHLFTLINQNDSIITIISTTFKDLNKVVITNNNSHAEILSCNFENGQSNFIANLTGGALIIKQTKLESSKFASIVNEGYVKCEECEFCKSKDTSISCFNESEIEIYDCTFSNSNQTSLFVNDSDVKVFRSKFIGVNGNCVNSICCEGQIADCSFLDSSYPHVSLAQNSNFDITNCTFKSTPSSCVMCRRGSTLRISGCLFEDTDRFGLATCEGHIQECRNCTFNRCKHACVSSFDKGVLNMWDCQINGPSEVGIETFCGGEVHAKNITMGKMEVAEVRCRFGGFIDLWNSSLPENPNIVTQGRKHEFQNVKNVEDKIIENTDMPSTPKCWKCGKDCSKSLFSSCAHACYCSDCIEQQGYCPLCRLDYDSVIQPHCMSEEDDTCGICMEEKVDAILIPCGHMLCKGCWEKWFKQSGECPFCRHPYANCRSIMPYS